MPNHSNKTSAIVYITFFQNFDSPFQVSTYCRRVELASRLGDTPIPPSTFQQEISSVSDGVRKRVNGSDTSWLFGNLSSHNADALNPDSLSETEFKQLEMENAEVYLRFISERNEVQRLGSQITEISRLQSMVTESLVEQAEARFETYV